jgi:hypothetical protein
MAGRQRRAALGPPVFATLFFAILLRALSQPLESLRELQLDRCFGRESEYEMVKLELERRWRDGDQNLTIFFAHVHHAGGTAVCSHATKMTTCNPDNNCHHPDEFNLFNPPPTHGTREEQLRFQRETPWRFYSVEKQMPLEMVLNGPFLYLTILRHPYLLTISNFLRQRTLKGYRGSLGKYLTGRQRLLSLSANYFDTYQPLLEYFAIDPWQPHARRMRQAFEKLEKFSVILLTDDMGRSAELLRLKLGWDLEGFDIRYSANMSRADKIHRNSQGPTSRLVNYLILNLTSREKRLFRATLRDDLAIFRYARCLVQRQLGTLSLPPLPAYRSKFGALESGLASSPAPTLRES